MIVFPHHWSNHSELRRNRMNFFNIFYELRGYVSTIEYTEAFVLPASSWYHGFEQLENYYWIFILKWSCSDDHYGKIQTRNHEISTNPGPQDMFLVVLNSLYMFSWVHDTHSLNVVCTQFSLNVIQTLLSKIIWTSLFAKRIKCYPTLFRVHEGGGGLQNIRIPGP